MHSDVHTEHTGAQICSTARQCGLTSSKNNEIQWNTEYVSSVVIPHVRADEQITPFDVSEVFHLSAIIKVPQPKLPWYKTRPFGQGIREEAISGASLESEPFFPLASHQGARSSSAPTVRDIQPE